MYKTENAILTRANRYWKRITPKYMLYEYYVAHSPLSEIHIYPTFQELNLLSSADWICIDRFVVTFLFLYL